MQQQSNTNNMEQVSMILAEAHNGVKKDLKPDHRQQRVLIPHKHLSHAVMPGGLVQQPLPGQQPQPPL